MSMLAERKRKQKWSLNPRGKLWSEDGNKFGQKMLEKMGWSVGKGLGAKEDGLREHVKISYKNDSKGMGFKETNDQWTEHEDNFSKLLEQLKTSDHITTINTEETRVKSLVEKSKSSKARVHYHKFTKGKDLSGYSEKDLANIFGRKNLKKSNVEPQEKKESEEEEDERRFGVETVRGGSMVDYFKKKLGKVPMQSSNGYEVGSNGVLTKVDRDSDTEMSFAGFGFSSSSNGASKAEDALSTSCKKDEVENCLTFYTKGHKKDVTGDVEEVANSSPTNGVETKRRKKKKSGVGSEQSIPMKLSEDETAEVPINDEGNTSTTNDGKKRKKKKRSVTSECEEVNLDVSTKSDDMEMSSMSVEEAGEKTKTPEEPEVKKKSKRKSLEQRHEEINFDASTRSEDMEISSMSVEKVVKKSKKPEEPGVKKKSKKHKGTEEESTFVSYLGEDSTPKKRKSEADQCETPTKKKKKDPTVFNLPNDSLLEARKKKKKKSENAEEMSVEVVMTKKRKKKAKDEGVVNFCFEDFDENRENEVPDENPYEVKTKKKRKKSRCAFENPTYSESAPDNGCVNDSLEIPRDDGGISNPALDLNSSTSNEALEEPIADDLIINVVSESLEPNPPSILQTPTPKKRVGRKKSVRFSDVNEERIIPNKDDLLLSPEELRKRMEVFDISRMIFERGMEKRRTNVGLANDAFDPIAADSSRYDGGMETQKRGTNTGIANVGFNDVQENVERLTAGIDECQAQVENDLNEARMRDVLVGETGAGVEENVDTQDGTRLSFKKAKFNKSTFRLYTEEHSYPKKSYKHLIKGDILVQFKNTNLGNIPGYANT